MSDFKFYEHNGMILLRDRSVIVPLESADNEPSPRWQQERFDNHRHQTMSLPERELVQREVKYTAELSDALRLAFPERAFLISHITAYAVSFFQPEEGAPKESITKLREWGGATASCVTCQKSQPYQRLPVPDPQFPFVEWGKCEVCGNDMLLTEVEIIRYIAPTA